MNLDPIALSYTLTCPPEQAFDAYVRRVGDWWHPDYTASPATLETVVIEPRVGGRVYERHSDGREFQWGEVTVWEPARRLAYTSTLAQSRAHPSEITVRFAPLAGGSSVHFEHGGWNEDNAKDRQKFGDWSLLLDRYTQLANQT